MRPDAPPLHEGGNLLRRVAIAHGDLGAAAPVVVTGEYEVGMQDQAFLGPESGLAVPDGAGGVELHIATQWLHVDRDQVALSLGLPPERVRLTLGGVGGAFGGREDLSMQIHACLLALRTGRPVKMVYSREESFFGHVHRHPCRMRYEHGATEDGRLVFVRARIVLDGGAYASSSTAVCSNAACFAAGPVRGAERGADRLRRLHEQPAVRRDARLRRRAGRVRARGADGQARRGRRHGPDRAAAAQRDRGRRPAAHRPGRARARARRRAARARPRHAAPAGGGRGARSARAAGRRRQHDARRGRAARRRLRGRDQEHRLLRGLRRLLDRARARLRSTPTGRSSRSTPRRPRSGRASSPCRPRSPAPSWASSAWSC